MHETPSEGLIPKLRDDTQVVPVHPDVLGSPALRRRLAVRQMTAEAWIDRHASGTLRKNARLGFAWREQYLGERAAFEFGWAFVCVPRSRVTWGTPVTEGDNHAITEAGWHIDRMLTLWPYPEDVFEVKYSYIAYETGMVEGVGLVLRQTSAAWVPQGYLICALVAEYDEKLKTWKETTPC